MPVAIRVTSRIQDQDDVNITPGAGTDGYALTWDDGTARFVLSEMTGGGGVTDILYADLVTAIGADGLTAGAYYRITDYATTHYIGAWDAGNAVFQRYDINVGTTEPLIVQASGVDTLAPQAYSATYPQDVIYYDWNPANWLTDESFIDEFGATIAGFTGVISSRYDTIADVLAPGDWRACLTRRFATAATAWNGGTTYAVGDIVSHAGTSMVYKALAATTNQEPAGADDEYWIVMLDLATYTCWNVLSNAWHGIPSDDETYEDYPLFEGGTPRSVHIKSFAYDATVMDNTYGNRTILPNSVFFGADSLCFGNTIAPGFSQNTCGFVFLGNTIGADCSNNTFVTQFYNNTVSALFYSNHIGLDCYGNVIATLFFENTIGSLFQLNMIGANFAQNIVGGYCNYNSFSGYSTANVIGMSFSYNALGSYFNLNIIGTGYVYNTVMSSGSVGIDYTGATHVYGAYNCEIYLRLDGTARLRYTDNSDALVVVAPTA